MEHYKATSIFQILNIFFQIVDLRPVGGLPIAQVSGGFWYTLGQGQGLVSQFQPMGNGVPILNWQLIIDV